MKAMGLFLLCVFCVATGAAVAPVARQGDPSAHGGSIAQGLPTVLVNGKAIARFGDMHVCPMVTGLVPHVGGPIASAQPTVLAGGMQVAVVGSVASCVGPMDTIVVGSPNVLIGGFKPAPGAPEADTFTPPFLLPPAEDPDALCFGFHEHPDAGSGPVMEARHIPGMMCQP